MQQAKSLDIPHRACVMYARCKTRSTPRKVLMLFEGDADVSVCQMRNLLGGSFYAHLRRVK